MRQAWLVAGLDWGAQWNGSRSRFVAMVVQGGGASPISAHNAAVAFGHILADFTSPMMSRLNSTVQHAANLVNLYVCVTASD